MDDINLEISQILVDGVNMTQRADMRTSNLTLVPQSLSSGEHQIKVILFNNNGVQYNPVIWNFLISGDNYKATENKLYGKIWNDYINNKVDRVLIYKIQVEREYFIC